MLAFEPSKVFTSNTTGAEIQQKQCQSCRASGPSIRVWPPKPRRPSWPISSEQFASYPCAVGFANLIALERTCRARCLQAIPELHACQGCSCASKQQPDQQPTTRSRVLAPHVFKPRLAHTMKTKERLYSEYPLQCWGCRERWRC